MAEQDQREDAAEPSEEAAAQTGGAGEGNVAEEAPAPKADETSEQAAAEKQPAGEAKPARPERSAAPEREGGRKEREVASAGPSSAIVVPGRQPGQPVVSRRGILRVGFWSSLGAILAGSTAAGVNLLYPRGVTGFGGRVSVAAADVPPPGGKKEIAEGRLWLANLTEEQGGPGLLGLWWKCPHLGCTVPWKPTFVWPDPASGAPRQGWFRCPCHGSTYTDAGIRVFGPAPRSLDTMALTVENGRVLVDTGNITPGGPDNPSRAVRI